MPSIADMNEHDANRVINLMAKIRKAKDEINANAVAVKNLLQGSWDLGMKITIMKAQIDELQKKGERE